MATRTAPPPAVPRIVADLIRRPRLFKLLDRGALGPVTLLSAPAGSGVWPWSAVVIPDTGHFLAEESPDELAGGVDAVQDPLPQGIGRGASRSTAPR